MENKQRDYALDIIRILATFCVVFNHVVETIYPLNIGGFNNMSFGDKLFGIGGFTFGRMGVTLFLLLTGYLLLPRTYDKEGIKKFYKKNFLPLFVAWEIWIAIYQLYICLFNDVSFNILDYLGKAFFLRHAGLPHTWYMPMILGVYLFIPFVANALKSISGKTLFILVGISIIYIFIIPNVDMFFWAFGKSSGVSNQLDLSFGGTVYGAYILIGYAINRYKDKITEKLGKRWIKALLMLFGIAMYALTIHAQFRLYSVGYCYNVWYSFTFMPFIGASVFMLLMNIKVPVRIRKLLAEMSACSFGVYLIHELILQPSLRAIGVYSNMWIEVIIASILVFIIAFILVALLSRIPYMSFIFVKKTYKLQKDLCSTTEVSIDNNNEGLNDYERD